MYGNVWASRTKEAGYWTDDQQWQDSVYPTSDIDLNTALGPLSLKPVETVVPPPPVA